MSGGEIKRLDNRMFTMIGYRGGMLGSRSPWRRLMAMLLMICGVMWSAGAQAQNCAPAATQGSAPASWQSYCWLNLTNYNDTTARSASGQNLSFTLPDGSVLSFNARVSGANPSYNAVIAPSWGGAAVGNSAFVGIPGRPVLYTASPSTSTIAITNITVTPPAGGGVTVYSFVVADAESTNDGEALRMSTNGGAWTLLDSVPPISGGSMPTLSGVGTTNVTMGGSPGTVGGYIIGSNSPTSVTVETQTSGGLQGVMFAIRFATIRLQTQILGSRLAAADQFTFQIASTATGGAVSSGTTSGTGTGPFTTAPLNMAAGIPVTMRVAMASGSTNALTAYSSILGCTNTSGATRPALPTNTATTNLDIGQLEFGESLVCAFTLGAPPRLRVRKALGTNRRFDTDQFTMRIMNGRTVVASSTTTGTGNTIGAGTGDTTLTVVNPSQAYIVDEAAAGTAVLGNYNASLACTNATSGTGTTLPTTVGGAITLRPGDTITCTITNNRRSMALLQIEKTSAVISDPVNGTANPKLIPGAIVEYAITVRNVGAGTVDASSVVVVDVMPAEMAFAVTTPVTFTNGTTASGLSFATSNVTYSQTTGGTTNFTYTPTGTYDGRVTGIRIAPTGTMAAATSGTAQPSFTIRFRAQVE